MQKVLLFITFFKIIYINFLFFISRCAAIENTKPEPKINENSEPDTKENAEPDTNENTEPEPKEMEIAEPETKENKQYVMLSILF